VTRSRLYYEAHVTVEAGSEGDDWTIFASGARSRGWRASKFDEDEVDDMSGKWFLSFRDPELSRTKYHVRRCVEALESSGRTVLRWKIEDTVLDSKHGDTLEALEETISE
jgi:hypothetical protein